MHVYPGEALDGAADGGAVTSHNRSINQGLSKLGHAGRFLLLVGFPFDLQAWGGQKKVSQPSRNVSYYNTHIHTHYTALNINTLCHTCLGDGGCVLAKAWLLAHATEVLAVHAEHVLVAHDQIRRCAVCPSVVLVDSVPFLERDAQKDDGIGTTEVANSTFGIS